MGVSWGRAFRAAVMVILYSLVWVIVGGIIIAVSYSGRYDNTFTFILVIVGAAIIWLGVSASFFKVQTDLVADEVENRMKGEEYVYTCKNCGGDLVKAGSVGEMVTWRCEKCGKEYSVSIQEQSRDGVR